MGVAQSVSQSVSLFQLLPADVPHCLQEHLDALFVRQGVSEDEALRPVRHSRYSLRELIFVLDIPQWRHRHWQGRRGDVSSSREDGCCDVCHQLGVGLLVRLVDAFASAYRLPVTSVGSGREVVLADVGLSSSWSVLHHLRDLRPQSFGHREERRAV